MPITKGRGFILKTVQVLLSTYNGEKYLKEQILSLQNQKSVDCRILVRDDGSSDATADILNSFQLEGVLKWYSGINLKPADSFRNLIFNAPEAEYYAFCDQDDIWNENKLKVAIDKLEQFTDDKPAMYFCKPELVDVNLNTINNEVKEPLINLADAIVSNKATGCTIVLNRKLLDLMRLYYPEKRKYLHDWWAYIVCISCGGNIEYDSKSYIKYRQHNNNVVGAKENIFIKSKRRIRLLFLKNDLTRSVIAEDLLKGYSDMMSKENISLLQNVARYRSSIKDRFKLAADKRFKINNSGSYVNFLIAVILEIF